MSKSNKSNPDKGLRTISIDFAGESRTLKFGHSAIGDLEADCNAVLRSLGAIQGAQMVFSEGLMSTWLGNARIFSYALYHGLGKAMKLAEIDDGIDAYIQSGGKKVELVRAITRAYYIATDPSILSSLERNWKASDGRTEILTDAENKQIEAVEKAIAEAKVKMLGSPSESSAESS